jgi:NADPH-dependent 2,4-dienoyl-CoA reductase/sulfur reductase-like enzyme
MIGIVGWRLAELARLGVDIHYNLYADPADVLALAPDMVVIATGGLPQPPEMAGADLGVSSWDILSGAAKPAPRVLVYDDNGAHPGMSAAEVLSQAGSVVELVSPERFFAPEIGGMNHVPYMRAFQAAGTRVTIATRLTAIRREGNELIATLGSDYASGWAEERRVDQVVLEHGTAPLDELYFALKPLSRNLGAVDHAALVGTGEVFPVKQAGAGFTLYRIGDAVASRNIHAGIYDALRYGVRW